MEKNFGLVCRKDGFLLDNCWIGEFKVGEGLHRACKPLVRLVVLAGELWNRYPDLSFACAVDEDQIVSRSGIAHVQGGLSGRL